MYKHYLAALVIFGLLASDFLRATTVVYAISPLGIVVGADGKFVPSGTGVKVVLLKKHFAVADIDTEVAKSADSGAVLYDFPTWIKQIDDNTSADISLPELVEVIKKQMPVAFGFAISRIKSGQLTREKAAVSGADSCIVQYIIAGYDKGVPRVYSLALFPDWNTKAVKGPVEIIVKEGEPKDANPSLHWFGQHVAIEKANIANTNEQRELSSRIKTERDLIASGKSLSLDRLSNVARALLAIETEANPRYVGLPFTIVSLPKIGNGWSTTYDSDLPSLPSLPKNGTAKGENEQKKAATHN